MPIISVRSVAKKYKSGQIALQPVDLEIEKGEIFALLGPNGAGKTTLISIICGTVTLSAGTVLVAGHDILHNYRAARALIGLVPQEIALDIFATVWNTVRFSRGLFGRSPNPVFLEQLLRDLSLWDKRDAKVVELSGGMKRRVMIAKALSHDPDILFLDEPTAGVDVSLRRDMWALVRRLRERGVTIILTTHYIEEAEEMADRVGVIDKGRLLLVERKADYAPAWQTAADDHTVRTARWYSGCTRGVAARTRCEWHHPELPLRRNSKRNRHGRLAPTAR